MDEGESDGTEESINKFGDVVWDETSEHDELQDEDEIAEDGSGSDVPDYHYAVYDFL